MTTAVIIIAVVYVLDSDMFGSFINGLTGRDARAWAHAIGAAIAGRE